jgi:hypothetical protein
MPLAPDGSQGHDKFAVILTNAKPEDGGDGPRNPDFESDDFTRPVKERLGQYLRRTIAEGGSVYTPNDGKSFQDEVKLGSEDAIVSFDTLSNSGLLLPDVKISIRNKPEAGTTSRTELYRQIDVGDPDALIPSTIARVQEENNRFSGRNPYIPDNATEDTAGTQDFIPQQRFGERTPTKWPDSDGQNNIPIKISQLKKLGTQILLESSGETSLVDNAEQLGDSPSNRASVIVVPGIARIGAKVPVSRFSAGTIMSRVNPTFVKPTISDLENDGPEKLSYGSPYNPLVRFNSLNTSSGLITATLLTMTVYAMSLALASILKNTSEMSLGGLEQGSKTSTPGKDKWMGSSTGQAKAGLGNSKTRFSTKDGPGFFMFYKTQNGNYAEAIKEGMKIFFDLSSKNPGFTVSNTQSPDFHNVILRSLVRDSTDTFSENRLYSPLKSIKSDPSSLGKAIDNTEAIITNLRDSKLFRFMDVIAQLGDLSLSIRGKSSTANVLDYDTSFQDVVADNDAVEKFGSNINQSSLIFRNRLSPNASRPNSLTMASNTVFSMYRLPAEYTKAQTNFTGDASVTHRLLGDKAMYFKAAETERLSPELVERFEQEMDSYYVPFYFQDLRTNEFIAFHAFLETVSDSFNADYVEGEGMGRIGKTYSYKNTNRSINLSFHVVSTNAQDFDEMWFKINKLTSLLYPQYTQGREVTNVENGHRFIQPFSQIVASSPMIRLRVGDLIKTNFSDLDLARLFGIGTENFTVSKTIKKRNDRRDQLIQNKINEITLRQQLGFFEQNEIFRLSAATDASVWTSFSQLSTDQQATLERSERRAGRTVDRQAINQSTVRIPNGTVVKINAVRERASDIVYEISPVNPLDGIPNGSRVEITINPETTNQTIAIMPEQIRILARNQVDRENPTLSATEAGSQSEIDSFFSSEAGDAGNPIVQAFQSTTGEGLAGFIKSMKFDWNGAIWETNDPNSRAPKFMKIDIDFAPVHDISPGLSSDGFMIGAPYNIGSIMQAMKQKRRNITPTRKEINSSGAQSGTGGADSGAD